MVRTNESLADSKLRDELAREGIAVSRFQLERWRQYGLLPRATVIRANFGGSEVLEHDSRTRDAAECLAYFSKRGRSRHHLAYIMFGFDLPISEQALRLSAGWLIEPGQDAIREAWEEALQTLTPISPDPEEQLIMLAEKTAHIVRNKRALKPLIAYSNREVRNYHPNDALSEIKEKQDRSLLYRIIEIVHPGSLTDDEAWIAITGDANPMERADFNPGDEHLLPSYVATVGQTITLAEAYLVRRLLHEKYLQSITDTDKEEFVSLMSVIIEVGRYRLSNGRRDHRKPFTAETFQFVETKIVELESERSTRVTEPKV